MISFAMNSGQHIYGYQDWHLPSPTSTPKSATFPEGALQTPKSDTFQSHFLDAFSTPQINAHHTPAQTPQVLLSTPLARPQSAHRRKVPSPEDPEFHVNYFSPVGHLPLPPVDPSRRLSSSPGPDSAKSASADSSKRPSTAKGADTLAMDPSQIQTPPPTRDSSSRRKSEAIAFSTPSTTVSRRGIGSVGDNFTSGASRFSQAALVYPGLRFSPEVSQFPHSGPATAPVMSQSRLFWDPNQSSTLMEVDMQNVSNDPFGPTPHKPEVPFTWGLFENNNDQSRQLQQQSFNGLPTSSHEGTFLATSSMNLDQSMAYSQPNSFATTSGVDPNLIFSFSVPSDDMSFSSAVSPAEAVTHRSGRQPYEQQARESQRERELSLKTRQHHSRTNTASSAQSQIISRPALHRSNTDSGFRRARNASIDSRSSGSSGGLPNIPRRSSPLKRLNQGSLTAIPETIRPRPRTRLVIDENGRARTETDAIEQPSAMRKDLKIQYPGLWNDDDSDSDADRPVLSQNNSFSIPPPSRRPPKQARLDSNADRLDSSQMPRSSSSTSLNSLSLGQRGLSFDRNNALPSPNYRRYSMSSLGGLLADDEPNKDNFDSAGDALKKVMEGRLKRQGSQRKAQGALDAHNQRWAQASAEMNKPTNNQELPYDPFAQPFTDSPRTVTEPDLATPSTDRSSLSSETTRCLCNSTDGDGQLMIQCESCTKWLHVRCVGLHPQSLPLVYVCIFCTGSTPAVRHGRVREPIRAAPQFMSPLNHKSTYRR